MKQLKNSLYALGDKILIFHRKNTERRKIREKNRVDLYSQIKLSSSQLREIDDLYTHNYGKKVPYMWHKYYTYYTGKFCAEYIPELIFIPEIEHFFNRKNNFCSACADKNFLPIIAKYADVKMPHTFLSRTNGTYKNEAGSIITAEQAREQMAKYEGYYFIKPTIESSSGNGCRLLNCKNGIDVITGESINSVVDRIGKDFVVQEKIECSNAIRKLYPNSVNTFRIITYVWNDAIQHCPIVMRIGQKGGFLDNAHAGGMFIAVDDDGTLHEKAFTENGETFSKHPDSGVVFSNYSVNSLGEVLSAAKKLHSLIPQIGLIHWDFTMDSSEVPVLIEANTFGGGIWVVQMAHGKGAFGVNTAEILRWIRKEKNKGETEGF